MKIISILLLKHRVGNPPIVLASEFNLSDFGYFTRGSVKEVAIFVSREVVGRTSPGQAISVKHKEYVAHAKVTTSGLAAVALSDEEYVPRVAHALLQEALDAFMAQYGNTRWADISTDSSMSVKGLADLLMRYQKPEEVDKILKIQKELNETKQILLQNIDQLLERGERIEDLARKSDDLSFQTKAFAQRAEDLNSCCTLL